MRPRDVERQRAEDVAVLAVPKVERDENDFVHRARRHCRARGFWRLDHSQRDA